MKDGVAPGIVLTDAGYGSDEAKAGRPPLRSVTHAKTRARLNASSIVNQRRRELCRLAMT